MVRSDVLPTRRTVRGLDRCPAASGDETHLAEEFARPDGGERHFTTVAVVDPSILDHIVTNLVTNALRYGQAPVLVRRIRAARGFGTRRACHRWRTERWPERFVYSSDLTLIISGESGSITHHVLAHAQTSRCTVGDSREGDAHMSTSATPEPLIRQIVDAMRSLAGPHPGFRPVHAKGLVCSGTFRASADASRTTRAPHFAGQSVPTIVRFANANGNPDVHDGVPNVRSMAVKFQLSDGKNPDILGNSVEGFVARTPEELLEFLRAQLPVPATGRPDPDAVPRFLAGHPAGRGFVERLMKRPVPASYAQTTYYAEHAFRFTAADGTSRFGRYRFVPQAGEAFLSPDDAGKRSASFLREELEGRLRTGSVAFRLLLQLAEAGDPTDDCGPRVGPWSSWAGWK